MTRKERKVEPKGDSEIPRIGIEPSAQQKFLNWIRRNATLLSIAGVLASIVIGVGALIFLTISSRFDDAAVRIGDTQSTVRNVEDRLGKRIDNVSSDVRDAEGRITTNIGEVKTEVRAVEGRLGKRIDDLKTEIREARQERKSDMNAIRLDIQGLRQDRPQSSSPETPNS